MTAFEEFKRIEEAENFFNEYQNMARLVEDLDVRFWKRFVMKDFRRADAIDNTVGEDKIRKQYYKCVSDLVALRGEMDLALESITDGLCHDLVKDYYIRGMSFGEIEHKWNLEEPDVSLKIQKGLCEAEIPERYRKQKKNNKGIRLFRLDGKRS